METVNKRVHSGMMSRVWAHRYYDYTFVEVVSSYLEEAVINPYFVPGHVGHPLLWSPQLCPDALMEVVLQVSYVDPGLS